MITRAQSSHAPLHKEFSHVKILLLLWLLCAGSSFPIAANDFPDGFESVEVFSNLQSPAGFAFSPDGRMFICERINGQLRVATYDTVNDQWALNAEPFYTFDIPQEGGVPSRHRSSGLRDIAFDPDFATNGYIYAFYMKDNPRQNRVVRIKTNAGNPDLAEPGSEELLLEVPYNNSQSSGSHNGGAIEFGPDGMLYITTGDGWDGGDPVQSLSTFTGKLFRIAPDGSIPTDNPFYAQTTGDYRAIYAVGLRNPYSMTRHPVTGELYINEAGGDHKASIFTVQAAANYGHQGVGGIGTAAEEWSNGGSAGGVLITGGAWYPEDGYWPAEYRGAYFTALWGNNGASTGHINYVRGTNDPSVVSFGTGVGQSGLKPVLTRVGPDGNLYYVLTNYERDDGRVIMLQWTGQASVATPAITPDGGVFSDPVTVSLSTSTPDATIYYTLDGSTPDESALRYTTPFTLNATGIVTTKAFKEGLGPSGARSAIFTVGDVTNIPPVVDAGDDFEAQVGRFIVLSGANSYDPDGDELTLSWQWSQLSGPAVELFSAEDAVAFFTPLEEGIYEFQLTVTDGEAEASDRIRVEVVPEPGINVGLVSYWPLNETSGSIAMDDAGANDGQLDGPVWQPDLGIVGGALEFDGTSNRVNLGEIDAGGNTAMSIAFWFRADDFDVHDSRFVSQATGVDDDDHYWMVSTLNESALRFRLKAGGTTTTLVTEEGVVEPGIWYHIAATYDGATMRLYKDAMEVESISKTGLIDSASGAGAALGNQPIGAGDRPFDGLMDDVRIYSRALGAGSLAILADEDGQLPVELSSFEVIRNGGEVIVSWTTASELNNAGFEIQKLGDRGFEGIGWRDGKGTTTEPQTYSFTVPYAEAGRHAFRLKQLDFDGTVDFSKVVEITIALEEQYFLSEVYPNPFNPAATFNLTVARDQDVTIALYDVQGRMVAMLHQGALRAEQAYRFEINGAGLASGKYLVRAVGQTFTAVRLVTLLK